MSLGQAIKFRFVHNHSGMGKHRKLTEKRLSATLRETLMAKRVEERDGPRGGTHHFGPLERKRAYSDPSGRQILINVFESETQ